MTDKYLPYACPSISSEDIEEVRQVLSQTIITRGPLVEEFEKAVADYCGATYAVAFNTGTAALMAAYGAAEIGAHDSIISTPNTFVSTIGSAVQRSAKPIFLDIDRSTGNLSLEHLSHNINTPSSRGKTAIVPVHFSGIPVDIQAIEKMIKDPKTVIIEDAAHAIGSKYRDGSRVGSCAWSQMTIFSFHAVKTITTGEGGMVTTNDEDLFHRLRLYRNNGIEKDPRYLQNEPAPWYYEVVSLTGNYNFMEMQAALGLSQLRRIDTFIDKRQKLLKRYEEKLASIEHIRMFTSENLFVAPHLCVVQIDFNAYKTNRIDVMEKLKNRGIGTQVHYIPVYRHPYFSQIIGDISEYFPEMEAYYSQALSLPLFYDLAAEDVDYVVKNLEQVLKSH